MALTSFIIEAPTCKASLATIDFVVSIDIQTSDFSLIPLITGITLEISSSKLTGSENGLVDSPPISIIFAPFLIIANACSTATFLSKYWPPSEKESGVTFKIPMINDCFLSLESQSLNCLIFMCYFFEIFLPDNMTLISDSSIVSCSSSSSAIKCNRSIFSSSIFLAVSCAFLIIDTTS